MTRLSDPRPASAWKLLRALPLCAVLLAGAAAPMLAAPTTPLPSDDLFENPTRAAHRFDEFTYTAEERQEEVSTKLTRLRKALADRKLDGVVIATERNLNWATGGGKDTVVWAQRETPVKLLITADKQYLIANNIEGPRMQSEELAGLGYQWVRFDWHGDEKAVLGPMLRDKKIAFDHPGTALDYAEGGERKTIPEMFDFGTVNFPLTSGELKKLRWLGKKTVEVLEQASQVVRPGMTERDVQYLLQRELWYWDIFPTVVLTAVDERFKTYRHPVVVGATMKNYVALNVCARRWGLIVSTTRMVHFGEPDAKLAKAWKDGARVCAAMWAASKPGKTMGDVIGAAQSGYAEIGFPQEWKLHHQGGPIAGQERLFTATPGDKTKIIPGMTLAWNPTVQGTKFEDTVLVKADGTLENLTPVGKWPSISVAVGGVTYQIPTVLVRPLPK
jgi:antitoxin VapB